MSNPSIFANLPDDIIREHMLPYTYHVQPKSLLRYFYIFHYTGFFIEFL